MPPLNENDVPPASAGRPRSSRRPAVVILAAAALLALAAAAAIVAWSKAGDSPAKPADAGGATHAHGGRAPRFQGARIPAGKIAPDFRLQSESGRPLRLADQRGKLVLVAFLYSRCPDVCPLIAVGLDSVVRGLGKDAGSVRVLAVSVDPAGDTLPAVRAYIRSHRLGPEFHYLIGTRQQLTPVWRDYNIAVREQTIDEVVHAAPVLLLDRRGRARVYYQQPESAHGRRAIAHDLRLFLNRG
jgi:protein SCO1/2